MSKVVIGCKLPHGIVLEGIGGQIELNGMKTSLIPGGFGVTVVDADEAAYLFATYEQHAAFRNNSIFTSENAKTSDLSAIARELEGERTGFEGLNPDAPAPSLQPADEKALDRAKEEAERNQRPAIAPKSNADKEAANQIKDGA